MSKNLREDWVEVVPSLSALTLYYGAPGNALVHIGEFTQTTSGIVLLEHTQSGGNRWGPINGVKQGRGMTTNCTDTGPANFKLALDDIGVPGFQVRVRDTVEMEPIEVRIVFAGQTYVHLLRTEPSYVIAETPDLRDLTS